MSHKFFLTIMFMISMIFPSIIFADNTNQSAFPSSIGYTLRQDVSQRTGIPVDKLEIVKATHETWPDGCLGLGTPDELCAQMIVEGWQVVVSDGKSFWGYRTDNDGQVFRAEPTN